MASLVDDRFSIIIDDLKFTLISKSLPDFKAYMYSFNKSTGFIEDRKKIIFEVYQVSSKRLIGGYSAYTSVSELGIWRVCFLEPGQHERIYKFDNYIQATLIDIRLQMFINANFDLLPFVTVKDATGVKQIYSPEYLKRYPDVADQYTYIDGVNPYGAIGCTPAESDSLTNISNRFIPLFTPGLITIQQKSMFLEENYNLIQESYTKITEYNTQLDNFQAHVEIYEIQATKKIESRLSIPPNIIFQIGKFILDVIPVEERIHREGYYIFNMKLPEAKINKFGLYDHYISGTFINPFQGKASYKTEEDYITKPLNYIEQPVGDKYPQAATTGNELENIKSRYYFFTAYKNEIQFPIKQIIQFTGASASSSSAASSVPQAEAKAKSIGGYKRSKRSKKRRKSRKSRKNKKSRRYK
jgi:hypothetical protein